MCSTTGSDQRGFDPGPQPSEDVPRCRGLTRGEEHELAALIASGDQAARNRMVRAYLGLVVAIARGFQGRGLLFDDLVSEGNLGLIRAAEDFDPKFGTLFSTYAAYWVKQAIRDALYNRTAAIRLPVYMVKLLTRWRRTERTLIRQGDGKPDFEAVASTLGLSERQRSLVCMARRAGQVKRDGSCGAEAANFLLEQTPDQRRPVEALLEAHDQRDSLMRRMERLNECERAVLAFRYGLDGELLTLREIGTRLGLLREQVREVASGAIRKLRRDHDHGAAISRPERQTSRDSRADEGRNWEYHPAQAMSASGL
jgi:RNA polymerase primary sigma factor